MAKQEWKRSDKTVIEYDDDMFELLPLGISKYLHFKDTYVGPISLPKGLHNLGMMFKDCNVKPGCYFDGFDTKDATNMRSMFSNCSLPDGFTLSGNFDTRNVKYMNGMFDGCKMPDGFTLNGKFDTSNVINMSSMFRNCNMPDGFTLGGKFDTSNVTNMNYMFYNCSMPDGFILGGKFDTSKSTNMVAMFADAVVADDFTFGDKFNTQSLSVDCMLYMFKNSNISIDIVLRSNIDMDKLKEANVLEVKLDSMQDTFDKLSIDLQRETNADEPVYISLRDKLKILRESEQSEKTESKKLSAFDKMKSEKNKMDRDSGFDNNKDRSIVD